MYLSDRRKQFSEFDLLQTTSRATNMTTGNELTHKSVGINLRNDEVKGKVDEVVSKEDKEGELLAQFVKRFEGLILEEKNLRIAMATTELPSLAGSQSDL